MSSELQLHNNSGDLEDLKLNKTLVNVSNDICIPTPDLDL